MNSTRHIDSEDLTLFALQFLSDDEAAAILLHLEHCEECRNELAAIQGDLAIYAMTTEVHSPPALARERLLEQIAREPQSRTAAGETAPATADITSTTAAPAGSVVPFSSARKRESLRDDRSDTERRSAGSRFAPWLGWAAAAALAVTAGRLYQQRQSLTDQVQTATRQNADMQAETLNARRVLETLSDADAVRVTLTRSKQAPAPQGKATYLPEKGSLVFIASNLAPLEPYKTYELWIIPANGQSPIAAGTFHPDSKGDATVLKPDLPKGVVAKAFGVTIEDEGGSRTPTMPILLAGAAAGV